jgi:glycosyltransferase involved in cell wall biosynthesis
VSRHAAGGQPAVTVVVPTYHRPTLLRRAVGSILGQECPQGEIEVIVAVSDAGSEEDRGAADALSRQDPRVRVVVASRLGPAAARNAALAAARGPLIAFTDDDCEPAPGWLQAGMERLRDADLVQGRTVPLTPRTTRVAKAVTVDSLSWLWETCNLFVRRDAVERAGGFDESWNPKGRVDRPWGEDTLWGWQLIEKGASFAFEPRAEVRHVVSMRSARELMGHKLDLRLYPLMLRRCPEVRRRFYRGYFLNRQHAVLTASVGLVAASAIAAARGHRATAGLGIAAAVVSALSPPRTDPRLSLQLTANEVLGYGALVYGSLRHRRLLL